MNFDTSTENVAVVPLLFFVLDFKIRLPHRTSVKVAAVLNPKPTPWVSVRPDEPGLPKTNGRCLPYSISLKFIPIPVSVIFVTIKPNTFCKMSYSIKISEKFSWLSSFCYCNCLFSEISTWIVDPIELNLIAFYKRWKTIL